MTGRIRETTRAEAVVRARAMCGQLGVSIVYRLADESGGRDPFAADPASHWRTAIRRVAVASCDCAGFVAWALGYDRYQPGFLHPWEWINCDSAILDARGPAGWFTEVATPIAGDLVVFPSIDLDHDGSRDRVGHIGVIVAVSPRWVPGALAELRVAHCSDGNMKRYGRAIAETTGIIWSGADSFRGRRDPRWAATFLRYQRFAAATPAAAA